MPLYQKAAAPGGDQSGRSGLPSSAAFEHPRHTTRHAIRVPDQFWESVNKGALPPAGTHRDVSMDPGFAIRTSKLGLTYVQCPIPLVDAFRAAHTKMPPSYSCSWYRVIVVFPFPEFGGPDTQSMWRSSGGEFWIPSKRMWQRRRTMLPTSQGYPLCPGNDAS